jgi:PBSX family phage terminase large subunit
VGLQARFNALAGPVHTTKKVALRGGAQELLKCKADEVLLAGPAGTGKSYAALYKVHLMCMLNPGMRALICRKTHKSLTATGLVTFREQVAKEAVANGVCHWYGGSGEKPAQYIYTNGSVIVVGGLDQVDKIMSAEYDVIYVQEATDCTPDDLEKLTTRLRNGMVSFQQLIMDCNPQQPTHHLKLRCDEGKTVMLYGRHEDNPRLFREVREGAAVRYEMTKEGKTYLDRLDNLSGVRRERLRYGRWAAAEGIIYGDWQPTLHLSDRKRLPLDWERIWAVDFGYTNPFVWQQWAVDPDGRLWLEKEIYQTERLVEDHAKQILEVTHIQTGKNAGQWKYPRPRMVICDHDAEDRATLERHLNLGTVPARKTVSDGIQAVQARLRLAGDGQPRLYVLRDALVERDQALKDAGKPTCFAEEIEGYVWKPGADGKPVPDEPLKLNDHSMDATRYAVAQFDLVKRARVRWM